jgi:hypothetical protein
MGGGQKKSVQNFGVEPPLKSASWKKKIEVGGYSYNGF